MTTTRCPDCGTAEPYWRPALPECDVCGPLDELRDARRELAADLAHEEWDAAANTLEWLSEAIDAVNGTLGIVEDAAPAEVHSAVADATLEYNAAVGRVEAAREQLRAEQSEMKQTLAGRVEEGS
jgi:hypothetical protein